ncbi:protein kinase domain-containing protein [Tundrisphaera sp. TA3]|uniref:protein kinase domain-containing protein n=1 Tax=Tundrisphaera sp. TA3 TaxID=3435775 RepID=UPI003EC14ED9
MTSRPEPGEDPPGAIGPAGRTPDDALDAMIRDWRAGLCHPAESYLEGMAPEEDPAGEVALELIGCEVALRQERGDSFDQESYCLRFPHLAEPIRRHFALERLLEAVDDPGDPLTTTIGDHRGPPAAEGNGPLPSAPDGYIIEAAIGRGGTGVVYLAQQIGLRRPVAIKMMRLGGAGDLGRFRTEAEAIARLRHPNVLQVHTAGEHQGRPYLVMEYMAGGSLANRLDGTPWPAEEAARLVRCLAGGIAEAHRLGVVHRDLKPDNILFAADGTPKIGDFGLAKLLDFDERHTQTGTLLGSPAYMAPEQADPGREPVGPPADLHALGVILYELLIGRPPFRAASVIRTLELVRTTEPVPPDRLQPGLSRDLSTICMKCLEKSPSRRYGTAGELAEDLRRHLDGEPILARPPRGWAKAGRWARKRPLLVGSAATVALLLAFIAVGSTLAAIRITRGAAAEARARDELKQTLYVSRMNLAAQAYEMLNLGRMIELLDPYRRGPENREFRGFSWRHWWSRSHSPRIVGTLEGPTRSIQAVEFSPRDSNTLATLCEDRTLLIRDARTGRVRLKLPVDDFRDTCGLAFSPDGSLIAARGGRGPLSIWDAGTGTLRARFEPGPNPALARGLRFLADGSRLIAISMDGQVTRYDPACKAPPERLPILARKMYAANFSPDSSVVALGEEDGTIVLQDAATGSLRGRLAGPRSTVRSLAFSPDGKTLAVGLQDQTIRLWDLVRSEIRPEVLRGHELPPWSLAYSPDGTTLASTSLDSTVIVWDAATGAKRETLMGHIGAAYCLDWSEDGSRLASAGIDGTTVLWDMASPQPPDLIQAHRGGLDYLAWMPGGKQIVSSGRDRMIRVWDAATGRLDREIRLAVPQPSYSVPISLSPGGRQALCIGLADGRLELRDSASSDLLTRTRAGTSLGVYTTVAHSPDGSIVATTASEGEVQIRDARDLRLIHALPRGGPMVRSLGFSPDGSQMAVGDWEVGVDLWDTKRWTRVRRLIGRGVPESIGPLSFSPDGKSLAVGMANGSAWIWDVATGRHRELRGHGGAVPCVAFSPDGRIVASASRDRTIKIWDVATGLLETTLSGHTENVKAVAFSPDSGTLASASLDGTIRLWRAPPAFTEP